VFLHSTLLIESAQQYLATDKPNFYSASYFATARTNHKTHLAQIVKVEKVAATGSPRKKSQTHLPARIFRPGETPVKGADCGRWVLAAGLPDPDYQLTHSPLPHAGADRK